MDIVSDEKVNMMTSLPTKYDYVIYNRLLQKFMDVYERRRHNDPTHMEDIVAGYGQFRCQGATLAWTDFKARLTANGVVYKELHRGDEKVIRFLSVPAPTPVPE